MGEKHNDLTEIITQILNEMKHSGDMSANVETMFCTRTKPWHGLGTRVEEAPTSERALTVAGLDWNVNQRPVYTDNGILLNGYKANVRDIDGKVSYMK